MNAQETKARVRKEYYFPLGPLGITVRKARRLKYWSWFSFSKMVHSGDWSAKKEELKPIFDAAVIDWSEFSYDDIWRDPEIAYDLYRVIKNGN